MPVKITRKTSKQSKKERKKTGQHMVKLYGTALPLSLYGTCGPDVILWKPVIQVKGYSGGEKWRYDASRLNGLGENNGKCVR